MLKKTTLNAGCILLISILTSFHPVSGDRKTSPKGLKTIIIDAGHGGYDIGAKGEYSNEASLTLQMALKLGEKLKLALPDCRIVYTRTDENLPGNLNNNNEANRLRAKIANQERGDLFIAIHVNSRNPVYKTIQDGTREETYYVYTGKGKKRKKIAKTRTVPRYVRVKVPNTVMGTETYIWASGKNDQKKQFVNKEDDHEAEKADSNYKYFDSPEAKIIASLKTAKYFNNSKLIAQLVEDEFVKYGRPSYGVKQRNHEGIWVLQATAMPSILVETGFICTPEDEAYLNSEKGQDEIIESIKNAVLKYKSVVDGKIETSVIED